MEHLKRTLRIRPWGGRRTTSSLDHQSQRHTTGRILNGAGRALRLALLVFAAMAISPLLADEVRHEINFPNLPGYLTLDCDLHMHTVFSDGLVWPTVRVDEAWRQGLDVISITDHIEYQPHKDDLPTKHNRPYELVLGTARSHGLLLIRGTEITRDTPPGHFNALFLDDIAPLDTKGFLDSIKQANEQGAFVFWNHQGWQGEEKGRWLEVHTTMYERKWLHGMEVCNGQEYYPSAHKWCLEKNLTMLGNSDIHQPDLRQRSTSDDHRTMTLVFAKERTLAAVKEALMKGHTAVWYKDQIIGRKELLGPLFARCVEVDRPHVRSGKVAWLQVRNRCETDIQLARTGNLGPAKLLLPAGVTVLVKVSLGSADTPLVLEYTAANFLIAPDTGLPVELKPGPIEGR